MGEVRFMISEAAKKVRVESHVLRYWEEELNLEIGRTEMGHRYYTKDDVQLFRCIKKLKDEGMLLKDLKPLIPQLKETRLRLKQSAAKPAQQDKAYVHSKETEKKTGTSLNTAANLARAAARHGISFSESTQTSEAVAANRACCADMEPEQALADQTDPYTVVIQNSGANTAKKTLHWGMAPSGKGQKASPSDLAQSVKGQKASPADLAQSVKGQKASPADLAQAVKGQKASPSSLGQKASLSDLTQAAKGQNTPLPGPAQTAKGQNAPLTSPAQAVKGQKVSQSALAGTDKCSSPKMAQVSSESGRAITERAAYSPARAQSTTGQDISEAQRLDAAAGHIMKAAGKAQGRTASTPGQKPGQKDTASLSVARKSDVVPASQLDQVRTLIGDVLTEVVTANNETLKKDISKTVTRDVMREMDFLFQARERQEEEHFRKLDCLIRQQQAHRRESARETPMGKLKKLLT